MVNPNPIPPPGKPKGAKNRTTLLKERAIAAEGKTPLQFLLEVMRDENNRLPLRLDAAKCAAPFVHPRLTTVDINDRTPRQDLNAIDARLVELLGEALKRRRNGGDMRVVGTTPAIAAVIEGTIVADDEGSEGS